MTELNPQPLPPHGGDRVRVYLSRDVAYNSQKMQTVTANILKQIGCGGCHSGRLLEFVTIESFVVNPKTLDLHEIAGPQF